MTAATVSKHTTKRAARRLSVAAASQSLANPEPVAPIG